MSRVSVSDLKSQLAAEQSNSKYWKDLYTRQCQATQTNYTELNNLRTQLSQLRQSVNSTHEHYQKALEEQDTQHAATLDACAQLAGQALKSQAEKANQAIHRLDVENALTMAELTGQRDAMDRAFKYLADRD